MDKINITVLIDADTLVRPKQYFNISNSDEADTFYVHSIDEVNVTKDGVYLSLTVTYCEDSNEKESSNVINFPKGK